MNAGLGAHRIILIAVLTGLALALLANPVPARAQGPFGGQIRDIGACAVPPGLFLTIGPPLGGKFIYIPGTTSLFLFGVIRPGAWTLGMAGPETGCYIRVSVKKGFVLQLVDRGKPILFMGTSL